MPAPAGRWTRPPSSTPRPPATPLARELVAEEADLIGIGVANLLHLFSPEVVVLGGGLANRFDALLPGIAARLARAAMPCFRDVPVVPAALGDNAGLVGAGLLVLDPSA